MVRFKSRRIFTSFVVILGASLLLYSESIKIFAVKEARLGAVPNADCGVVLTGAPGRIREAFEILAQKKIRKLVISGVYKETRLHQIFPHLPFYNEIAEDDVILEKKSESTYGNAIQSLALVNALKCRNILLITSQLHMFRAHRIFRDVYPPTIEIIDVAVSNRRDFNVFDYSLEILKSAFYWGLGLVA